MCLRLRLALRTQISPASNKTPKQLKAINGKAADFMEFVADDRFESPDAPVWMLNFLKFEAGGQALYEEYGFRAQVTLSPTATHGALGVILAGFSTCRRIFQR